MKHIKLFEQFIGEASNDKKIKDLQNDLTELDDRMEEIQSAVEKGDMDEDEAELQLSDLDAQKVEMEGELAELQGGADAKEEYGQLAKFINKYNTLINSRQSFRWSYMKNNCPAEEERMMDGLAKRDKAIEDENEVNAKKLEDKMQKISKDFSAETKAWLSYYITEYKNAGAAFSEAAHSLTGAQYSCSDYKIGCDNVKEKKEVYKKTEKGQKEAEAKLKELQNAMLDK
jgi:hypothetical protein